MRNKVVVVVVVVNVVPSILAVKNVQQSSDHDGGMTYKFFSKFF